MTRRLDLVSTVGALALDLRRRILDGDLQPGQRLVEREIVEDYEVARHTLRAALQTLAAEGLVTLIPNRGAQVAAPQPGDLEALYELRTALEVEAARLALARDPGALRATLEDAATRLRAVCEADEPPWSVVADAHAALHRAIVDSADAPRISAAYAALEAELRLILLALRPVFALHRMADHHDDLARDLPERGTDALREHLADGAAAILGSAAPE